MSTHDIDQLITLRGLLQEYGKIRGEQITPPSISFYGPEMVRGAIFFIDYSKADRKSYSFESLEQAIQICQNLLHYLNHGGETWGLNIPMILPVTVEGGLHESEASIMARTRFIESDPDLGDDW